MRGLIAAAVLAAGYAVVVFTTHEGRAPATVAAPSPFMAAAQSEDCHCLIPPNYGLQGALP